MNARAAPPPQAHAETADTPARPTKGALHEIGNEKPDSKIPEPPPEAPEKGRMNLRTRQAAVIFQTDMKVMSAASADWRSPQKKHSSEALRSVSGRRRNLVVESLNRRDPRTPVRSESVEPRIGRQQDRCRPWARATWALPAVTDCAAEHARHCDEGPHEPHQHDEPNEGDDHEREEPKPRER